MTIAVETQSDPLREARFGLPAGYQSNLRGPRSTLSDYWNPIRVRESRRFQHHVYRWAADLVARYRLQRVVDVGCGSGWKLMHHLGPTGATLTGMDTPQAIAVARDLGVSANLVEIDLEAPSQSDVPRADLLICADVIEHLVDPDPAVEFMRCAAGVRGWILISTPERCRLRGRGTVVCGKPDHVREWSRRELLAYLRSRGLRVVQSRLVPQDDAPIGRRLARECLFRARLAERSPLACHAVLCRSAAKTARGA